MVVTMNQNLSSALPGTSAATSTRPGLRQWAALAVLTMAVTLLAIDSTVLALAIPSLSAHLEPTAAQLLWVGDIYSFVLAGLLVTMGNVADRIGRRRLLLIGTVGFGASSVLAAFAPTAGALIAARALLGVSGATIMPSTLSLVRNLFPDARQRSTAIAVWSAGSSGGTALGPLVGGFLLEHFWWGSVFLINVPVMVVVLVAGVWLLPESRNPDGGPVDLRSSVLSILAIVPVVYAVKTLAHDGLTWQVALALAVGLVAGCVFLRRQKALETPLLDVSLFSRPAFTWAVASTVIAIFALAGLLYFFSQYLQLVRGYSTLRAGVSELPMALAEVLIVLAVGALVTRFGQGRTLAVGLLATAAGLVGLALAESHDSYLPLALALVVIGSGIGIAYAVSTDAVLSAVPAQRAGAASAISETGLELGAALGIAVLGTVQDLGYRHLLGDVTGMAEHLRSAAGQSLATLSGVVDHTVPAQVAVLAQAQTAFTHAMQVTASVAAFFLLVGAVMSWRRVPSGRVTIKDDSEAAQ